MDVSSRERGSRLSETFIYQRRWSENPWAISYEITSHQGWCEIEMVIHHASLKVNGRKSAYYEGCKNYLDVANWIESEMLGAGLYFDHSDYEQVKEHFLHRKGFASHVTRKDFENGKQPCNHPESEQ